MKVIVVFLLIAFALLRFWDITGRTQFTWDQVENAWVMKSMLVDGVLPLEGMVAKLNSGFRIGPAYYYLLAPFYAAFGLDPIAGRVFAGVVAVVSAIVFFLLWRKLFSSQTAIVGLAIYTFSNYAILHDRIAWPVVFIPLVSMIIFYTLYRAVAGEARYLPYLALALGFSLHIHFTSIFFFLIVLVSLPFLARAKHFWRYAAYSVPLLLIWLVPMFFGSFKNGLSYIQTYSHGFHFLRVWQLLGDAVIQFDAVLGIPQFVILKYFMLPLFIFVYLRKTRLATGFRFCLLVLLWFAVPLLVLSMYKGEISDYYFASTRPLVYMIYGYLTVETIRLRKLWITLAVVLFWAFVFLYNMKNFTVSGFTVFSKDREEVRRIIKTGGVVEFREGDPKSYLYYIYAKNR